MEMQPNMKAVPKVLKDIIDQQYGEAIKFYYAQVIIYFICYLLPLLRQMVCIDKSKILFYNISCIIFTFIMAFLEMITMRSIGFNAYRRSIKNWLDWLMIFLYTGYFYVRMTHIDTNLIPQLPKDKEGDDLKKFLVEERHHHFKMFAPICHALLTLLAFYKLLHLSICY